MPKPDKRSKLEASSSSSDSDSGPDDKTPAKKLKSAAATARGGGGGGGGGGGASSSSGRGKGNPAIEGQEPTWDLGKLKTVKVREWKGRTFIDIREYYVDKNTMDTKPGKKGISLTPEQYQLLKSFMPEIDRALP